jgi:hypothetical protein
MVPVDLRLGKVEFARGVQDNGKPGPRVAKWFWRSTVGNDISASGPTLLISAIVTRPTSHASALNA